MFDIAVPENNEVQLLNKYRELKYKYVIFSYYIRCKSDLKIFYRNHVSHLNKPKINCFVAAVVDVHSIKDALLLAAELFYNNKLYNDLIFIKARNYKFNQQILSKYYFNFLLDPGYMNVEDPLHSRYTGIPSNSFKNILKNKLAICFSLKDLKDNPKYLGRVIYLTKLLKKKNISIVIGSFTKNPNEVPQKIVLKSWYRVLGIPFKSSSLLELLTLQISRTRRAKNKDVFCDGYEIVKYPYEDFEDI